MLMFINEFIEKTDIADGAKKALTDTFLLVKDTDYFKELTKMIEDKVPFYLIERKINEYIEKIPVHKYTFMMTLLIANGEIMRKRFLENGADNEIFRDSMIDFKCKIEECKNVYDVWGIFPFTWYGSLFEAKVFKIGRLEFEKMTYDEKCDVINIHIPSCGSLRHEDVIDSYKRAFAFYPKTHGRFTAFRCSTYLLFPPYMGKVFKEESNTYKFANDFNIIDVNYTDEFKDAWRVFYKDYTGDTSLLPKDTSMQRRFCSYLDEGGRVGTACGVFMFDGEKIYKDEAEFLKDIIIKK